MQCFCGCGHKVSFGARSVNKRGATIAGDVAKLRLMLEREMKSPTAARFVMDGELLCAGLADGIHAGVDPGPELESETRGFMAFYRHNFSTGKFGQAYGGRGCPQTRRSRR